ncbi:MAG: glycosyltransferase family 4 protein [Candidatus Kaiserbacteria bacterium]|nr:glycosyltransferase family 4 protein [Candidatus Kaiserbacteria bacterium]
MLVKIILATPVFPPEIGGPATYTKELAKRLRDEHEVVIVAYASTSERIDGTTLFTISKRRTLPIRLIKYFLTLFKASRGADVIYVQNAMAAGFPAVLVGMIRHIPVVLKFVGDEAWERASQEQRTKKRLEEFLAAPEGGLRAWIRMALQGFVLRHADIVTTPSAYLRDVIVRTYRIKNERAVVNYNAGEETETAPFTATPVPHQIVTTARLVEWKGIDGIIRAIALLKKKFPDVRAIIVGDGPEEERLRKFARELNVADSIVFTGRVSRAETWHIRKSSEVYVLNSTYEGLPHTVLTSFAAHIPTVATDIPGTNEAVYNRESGLLVPAGDDQALVNAIARIFTDPALRTKIIEGADKILQEKFSWDAHLKTLLGFFESIRTKPRD